MYASFKALQLRRIPADTTPKPTITSCSPQQVIPGGGTPVVITGTDFMSAAPRPDAGQSFVKSVHFGTLLATSFTVDSATQITAVSPALAAGYVIVNTSGGCAGGPTPITYLAGITGTLAVTESADTLSAAGTVTGLAPIAGTLDVTEVADTLSSTGTITAAPTVTSITPDTTYIERATSVTITGQYFTGASSAAVGAYTLSSFVVVNDTTITGVVTPTAQGTYSTTVTSAAGTGTKSSSFFVNLRTIVSVDPDHAWSGGGTTITFSGFGLSDLGANRGSAGPGGVALTSVTVYDDNTVTGVTGAGSVGLGSAEIGRTGAWITNTIPFTFDGG